MASGFERSLQVWGFSKFNVYKCLLALLFLTAKAGKIWVQGENFQWLLWLCIEGRSCLSPLLICSLTPKRHKNTDTANTSLSCSTTSLGNIHATAAALSCEEPKTTEMVGGG